MTVHNPSIGLLRRGLQLGVVSEHFVFPFPWSSKRTHKMKFYPSGNNFTQALIVTNIQISSLLRITAKIAIIFLHRYFMLIFLHRYFIIFLHRYFMFLSPQVLYVTLYQLWYAQGYQEFAGIESSVTTKVVYFLRKWCG